MKTILIHGLGQTAGAWNKTAELLPQEDIVADYNLGELWLAV